MPHRRNQPESRSLGTSGISPVPLRGMKDATLREVLLLKALEEADPAGASLPLAVRETATREALRDSAAAGQLNGCAAQEAFLTARAKRLFRRSPSGTQCSARSQAARSCRGG